MPPRSSNDGRIAVDADPAAGCFREMHRPHVRAQVHHGGDVAPGSGNVERRVPTGIVVGEHDDALSRQHAVAMHESAHRAGEHDPGAVVGVEGEGALDRAGGEHDLLRPHAPEPLPRHMRWMQVERQVIGDALPEADEVVGVVAERRGAREHRHLRHDL